MASTDTSPDAPSVAVIGAGHWGKNLVRNFHELGALRSICEPDPDIQSSLVEQYPEIRVGADADDALASDVDAVAIATPAATHADLAMRALDAGKHVFVEKPLALTVADGERVVQLAADVGRVLMVGHLLWYHPAVMKLAEMVRDGQLGEVRYIYSNRLNLGKIRKEENILWSFAPHDISVILGLTGEMPEDVHAAGGTYLSEGVADATVTTFGFAGGIRAHVFVSWLHPFKEQRLVVVGDKQMAVFDDTRPTDKLVVYAHDVGWQRDQSVVRTAASRAIDIDDSEPLANECRHFLDCVNTGSAPRTDGAEGLRVLRVLAACQAALDAQTTVTPLPRR